MTRSDIHRPSTFNPAEYTAQDWVDLQQPHAGNRPAFRMIDGNSGGVYSVDGRPQCDCCGAHIRYAVIFRHEPSDTYIWTGEDCAEKFQLASRSEVRALKNSADRRNRRAEFVAMLEKSPGLAVIFSVDDNTIQDIAERGRREGSLSDRAIGYAAQRATWAVERGIRQAKEALAPKVDVPAGRMAVTGEVLSVLTWKMLVRDDRGFKVWGTIPRAINPARGDRVTFTAKLEQSKDDRSFGFFSRPTQAAIVPAVEVA